MASDPSSPRRGARLLPRLVLALLVLVGLFELAVRVLPLRWLAPDELDPARKLADARTEPHPYLAYALKPGWHSPPGAKQETVHNALGFRGPETTWEKPAGRFRIVCLGGSSTYGHTPSSNATTWPARLQVHLREALPDRDVEVLNLGCSGYSTFESVPNLAFRGLALDPDLVLVYHSINDVRCALYVNPKHADAPVERDNTHWRAPWPVDRPSALERWLEHSRTYLVLRRYLTDYAQTRQDLGYYAIVDYDPQAGDLYANPNPSPLGFESFRRNLESIVALARAHGAEAAFGTQGIDWSDFEKESPLSKKAQREGMERMTRILREVAAERGVLLVESAQALESAAAAEREAAAAAGTPSPETIFTHEVHLADAGADLLARTFATALVAAGLVR